MAVVSFGVGRKALASGTQKINLHQYGSESATKAERPALGSADLCFIAAVALPVVIAHLASCSIAITEGPVPRSGAQGSIRSDYFLRSLNLIGVSNYERA